MDDILDINTLFGPLPIASADLNVDALLTLMRQHNVGTACTLSTLGVLLDPAIGNAATRAACSEHPELLPVATLNPKLYLGDAAAVQQLKADGFRIVRFSPYLQGWPIEYAPFRAIVRALEPTGLPIMVTVNELGEISDLLDFLEGYPAPVILSKVDDNLLSEAIAALLLRANWHIETSYLLGAGNIKTVTDTVGVERVLFGTRAPTMPIASALHALNVAGLPDEARRQILAANAKRILQ
jgi:predicted TIM-barrel fold metal-dependent hydrolase